MTYVWEVVDKATGSVYRVFKTLEAAQTWMFKTGGGRFFLRRAEYFGKSK